MADPPALDFTDEGNSNQCSSDNHLYYCLNGGSCFALKPPASVLYCRCTSEYEGQRCEFRAVPIRPSGADALANPLIVAGLLLLALILVVLVFIAYFLAKFKQDYDRDRRMLQHCPMTTGATRETQSRVKRIKLWGKSKLNGRIGQTSRSENVLDAGKESAVVLHSANPLTRQTSPPSHVTVTIDDSEDPDQSRDSAVISRDLQRRSRICDVTKSFDNEIQIREVSDAAFITAVRRQHFTDSEQALICTDESSDWCDSAAKRPIKASGAKSASDRLNLDSPGDIAADNSSSEDDSLGIRLESRSPMDEQIRCRSPVEKLERATLQFRGQGASLSKENEEEERRRDDEVVNALLLELGIGYSPSHAGGNNPLSLGGSHPVTCLRLPPGEWREDSLTESSRFLSSSDV